MLTVYACIYFVHVRVLRTRGLAAVLLGQRSIVSE
jgi:hypothetical protein